MDLSEKETREKIIDPRLKDEGWKEEYIKREVNSVKSDFKIKKYEIKKGEGKAEGKREKIDEMFNSLMQKAFKGELVR